ncbi:MAG: ribonuclease HII [Caldilineaceae bacterium]
MILPTLAYETRLWQAGYQRLAGVDEVGRGALAGPVVAATVIVPLGATLEGVWAEVRDSKLLTPQRRSELESQIQAAALAWGIGSVPALVIDEIGIAPATRLAMREAVAALQPPADHLLIDWVKLPQVNLPQESFVKADQKSVAVAAASILAKVHRDRLLVALHEQHPDYAFHLNKGYGTAAHLAALERHGPCVEHRHRFAPVAQPASLFKL